MRNPLKWVVVGLRTGRGAAPNRFQPVLHPLAANSFVAGVAGTQQPHCPDYFARRHLARPTILMYTQGND